jgi:hypothetical protein
MITQIYPAFTPALTCQPIKQSINQPIKEPNNQPTEQPTNRLNNKLTKKLTNYTEQIRSWVVNVFPLVKQFPVFYGNRMYITAFKRDPNLSLWARSI